MTEEQGSTDIPNPAHPVDRHTMLPGERPKSGDEDPSSIDRLQSIIESQSYRPSIEDTDFLHSDDARTMRLQLDYLKPEMYMRKHGIQQTIVVFGGTRIAEPKAARKDVSELRDLLQKESDNQELRGRLAVAERIVAKSHYYDIARHFAELVARSGNGPQDSTLVIMTGGGPGVMEAANRGASDVGADTIGLNITLPREQYPNPYLTPELCFQFHYFALRKMHFMLRAKALVAFPGGFGTLDELFETLTLIQTRKIQPLPVVLVGEEFWRKAVDIDFLVAEGVIDSEDRDLFWYAETADEIWDGIKIWYQRAGAPLVSEN